MSFSVAEMYYFVTYPDVDLSYPKIETFVFAGNSSDEDGQNVFCFQRSEHFSKVGSVFRTDCRDRYVLLKTESDVRTCWIWKN